MSQENSTLALDDVMRKIRKLQKLYEGAKAINSEHEAEEQKYCGVTALIFKKDTAIQEYVDTRWKVGKGKRENGVKSSLAVSMGVKDGRNTDINKAIATTAKPRKQLS